MIIFYGWRWYGRLHGLGDEGLSTRCFHLFYIPLLPLGQMWIVRQEGRRVLGMPARASLRAALLYLALPWGLIGAAIVGTGAGAVGALPMVTAMAVFGWALVTTRGGARENARTALSAPVLGTVCPPELLTRSRALTLRNQLDGAWARRCPDRSPEDVAALGPRDHAEAQLAFALLAVRARLERGALAARLRAQADRIVDVAGEGSALPTGAPYRAEVRMDERAS